MRFNDEIYIAAHEHLEEDGSFKRECLLCLEKEAGKFRLYEIKKKELEPEPKHKYKYKKMNPPQSEVIFLREFREKELEESISKGEISVEGRKYVSPGMHHFRKLFRRKIFA